MPAENASFGGDSGAGERLSAYRRALLDVVSPAEWAMVLGFASQDAEDGDDRAREFVRRVLGVANAARVEWMFHALINQLNLSQVLDDVSQDRASAVAARAASALGTNDEMPAATPAHATHWSVAFDVITPARWRRIVDVALAQAVDGDPRAREWLARVLGAEQAGTGPDEPAGGGSFASVDDIIAIMARGNAL